VANHATLIIVHSMKILHLHFIKATWYQHISSLGLNEYDPLHSFTWPSRSINRSLVLGVKPCARRFTNWKPIFCGLHERRYTGEGLSEGRGSSRAVKQWRPERAFDRGSRARSLCIDPVASGHHQDDMDDGAFECLGRAETIEG
jgi:hypothetical protein